MKLNTVFKRFIFLVLITIIFTVWFALIGVSFLFFYRVREVPWFVNLLWKGCVWVHFSFLVIVVPFLGAVFVVRGWPVYRKKSGFDEYESKDDPNH